MTTASATDAPAPDVTITPPPQTAAPCGRCARPRQVGERIGWAGLTLAHVTTGGVGVRHKHVLCPSCAAGLLAWLEKRRA